jgi:hypothetical protein
MVTNYQNINWLVPDDAMCMFTTAEGVVRWSTDTPEWDLLNQKWRIYNGSDGKAELYFNNPYPAGESLRSVY